MVSQEHLPVAQAVAENADQELLLPVAQAVAENVDQELLKRVLNLEEVLKQSYQTMMNSALGGLDNVDLQRRMQELGQQLETPLPAAVDENADQELLKRVLNLEEDLKKSYLKSCQTMMDSVHQQNIDPEAEALRRRVQELEQRLEAAGQSMFDSGEFGNAAPDES